MIVNFKIQYKNIFVLILVYICIYESIHSTCSHRLPFLSWHSYHFILLWAAAILGLELVEIIKAKYFFRKDSEAIFIYLFIFFYFFFFCNNLFTVTSANMGPA